MANSDMDRELTPEEIARENAAREAELLEAIKPAEMPKMEFFGVDMGDGESAVSWLRSDTQTEPQMLEICGSKSIITALGVLKDGKSVIGEEACQIADPMALHLRFKSKYLKDTQTVSGYIDRFARVLVDELKRGGRMLDGENVRCAIGCPSGWNGQTRRAYAQLFGRAGFPNVRVVSESRAAFLYSRESGELRMSSELLGKPTLIIDAGSSTTDFTFVEELTEQRLPVHDFGDTALGGGLIEQELLRINLKRQDNPELNALLERYPQCRARCEMEARKVKEMYFTRQRRGNAGATVPCESSVKLYCALPPITVDISCDDADMQQALNAPLAELGGLSFMQAYKRALEDARAVLGKQVSVILMTGGASRMGFMPKVAGQVFPEALIVHGLEPEFAIARGLCYALRIDARAEGFTRDVEKLIKSPAVENIIKGELNRLFSEVSRPIARAICDNVAEPAFKRWRAGSIETINGIAEEIQRNTGTCLRSTELRAALEPYIYEWLRQLRPQLEALTDPICDRYDLPRTALRLSGRMEFTPDGIAISSDKLINFDAFKVILDVIVASIFAMIMGGAETALLAAGPVGLIVGAVLGLVIAFVGSEAADKKLRNVNLPKGVRRMFSEKRFHAGLERKQEDFAFAIFDRLMADLDKNTPEITDMVNDIADCLETQLRDMLNRAVLLIR
ncbi:MAG TPA: Hsp70 family protein [Candidatus Fimadaptatus faecigallinarum]|uniref:Hsp70 family protein n=1 Tax=Candidatus Fimadaptatus faecigallinarum TaxID=2840814 RepID=A0A9D1S4P2_9FIRM|nr:Hsp70 family protein [Candidatus Fimadaptatus faecigallinarum]